MSHRYTPPRSVIGAGSTAYDTISASLHARGVEVTRQTYLDEHGRAFGTDAHRPQPAESSPWSLRRQKEDLVGDQAHKNLTRKQGTYTSPEFHAEMERLGGETGVAYRGDVRRLNNDQRSQ